MSSSKTKEDDTLETNPLFIIYEGTTGKNAWWSKTFNSLFQPSAT